jgi:glycerol-3-phosphate dehydrogenase
MWKTSKTEKNTKPEFPRGGSFMGKKLVVVGGGAGGPSSAAEAKRRDKSLEATMVERGDFVSYAA